MNRTLNRKRKPVFASCIYKARKGHIYDPAKRKYNCYRPAQSGTWNVFDAWVCDKDGNVHPGYNISPVPVSIDALGAIVNEYKPE